MARGRKTAVTIAAALLLATGPALAHRLKLFATVDNGAISGYGFFIGGGKAKAATILFRGAGGKELHRMQSQPDGAFRWRPPRAEDIRIILNAGDGHTVETTVAAGQISPRTAKSGQSASAGGRPVDASAADHASRPLSRDELTALIGKTVDQAVARQIKPLLEAYDKTEGRLRFNDVMGGVGMLIGLAGIALWASGRRGSRRPGAGKRDADKRDANKSSGQDADAA